MIKSLQHVTLLAARTVLGGYIAVHGAQKLFGVLEGPGLDKAAAGFQAMGLTPAKPMAALAGGSELGGGILTIAGIADPIGPVAITGAMLVASVVHRNQGPMSAKGGYELPLTNLALALTLAAAGPGRLSLGIKLPKRITALALVGAAGLTGLSLVKLLKPTPAAAQTVEAAEAVVSEA